MVFLLLWRRQIGTPRSQSCEGVLGLGGVAKGVLPSHSARERLRKDLGVLCVEMEAAGLIGVGEMTGVVVCDQSIHANNLVAFQAAANAKSRELIQIRYYLSSACKVDHMPFIMFGNDSAPFGI